MTTYGGSVVTMSGQTAGDVASAFSSAVFKQMAAASPDVNTRRRIAVVAACAETSEATLADAFESAHQLLLRNYRNEYVFKNALVSKIVFGKHSPNTASALLELSMGHSWADVVIVNGTSTTYEVKTDLDQFTRLSTQLADYCGRSEYVNVVTSDKRAGAAERHLPDHVGIVAVRGNGSLTTVRHAESNLERMAPGLLFTMLRTGEAVSILRELSGYEVDVRPGDVWKRVRGLFGELSTTEAHAGAVKHLRLRGRTAAELASNEVFPQSMRALAYTAELSNVGRERIIRRLAAPANANLEK